MQQYTDANFGFSFWYPSTWVVTQKQVTDPTDGGWLQSGTTVKELTVVKTGDDPLHSGFTIQEFYSPTFAITELGQTKSASPVGVDQTYFFNSNTHTWMYENLTDAPNGNRPAGTVTAADVSNNTMGGLHMFSGAERFGANTIVPLSASDFLIISKNNPTDLPDQNLLVKTILATNPKVATPVSQAEQTQTIQAEANAYGVQSTPTQSVSGMSTYDNFGITFQYPTVWGVPQESFYGNGLASIFYNFNPSDTQAFSVSIEQDTNPNGSGLLNETLDQMIARFMTNDKDIYKVTDISANGIQGKELFYNNAVTGQPYHVEVYFPFQNNSYVSVTADYQSVPQSTFDSVISTLKWDATTAFKQDPATGMAIYRNNGIQFEYPVKFNSDYASLIVKTNVGKTDTANLDSNGCYPAINDSGKPSPSSALTINGIKFCSATSGGAGAGQAYNTYSYMTLRNGNVYTVEYSVQTSNGCSVYENSTDPNAPGNQQYKACLDFLKNFNSVVIAPIKQSISTFTFTK